MDPSLANSHAAALIGRLCTVVPPGLAPFVVPPDAAATDAVRQVAFRFSYREVPCTAISEHPDGDPILRLACNFGPLPDTAEGALPRGHALQAIAAARSDTGLDWHLSSTQAIIFTGDVAFRQPLTPSAMIAGVVELLLRADLYIGLMLEILGEAGSLTSPQAA